MKGSGVGPEKVWKKERSRRLVQKCKQTEAAQPEKKMMGKKDNAMGNKSVSWIASARDSRGEEGKQMRAREGEKIRLTFPRQQPTT